MNQYYREYLDAEINRVGTNCVKWDGLKDVFGCGDLTPAWVADMDFRTAPAVQEAILRRAQHAVYGYAIQPAAEKEAEVAWLKRRHGVDVQADWILTSPGVVDSIFFCVRALTGEHDKVLIQTPVYGPFFRAAELFGRELVRNPLIETERGFEMDFENLEAGFKSGVKLMILCNPHNPIGRVWSREDLEHMVELANRYGVIVVCDEIHADFNMGERRQTRILALEHAQENCVMLASATKSFNLAGLRQSSCIIANPELRRKVAGEMEKAHAAPNIFGAIAQQAAYEHGDEWMDAVVEYIRENRDWALAYIRENIPEIKVHPNEGTYLMWLDFSALDMSHKEIFDMIVNEAHVAIGDGKGFGEEGEKHFRFNLATTHRNVVKAFENINQAIRSR